MVDLEGDVEVAVVFDGVAVGVEDGGIPVAESLVAFFVVVGQAEVPAAGHVEFHAVAGEDDEGDFRFVAVMPFTISGKITAQGAIECPGIDSESSLEY